MTQNYPADVYVSKSASDPRASSDINQLQDDVKAHADDYITGWITAGETWVYASATTLTVSGDKTSKYRKGTKIKLTQTTAKYFYVVAVSYAAPNTTVTLAAGSDYTLANATITSPFYSYADCPQGFPDWFNWAPTSCGFSTYDPSASMNRFKIAGQQCFLAIRQTNSGCSGASTFTISLPVQAATVSNAFWADAITAYTNNASAELSGRCAIGSACTTMALYTNLTSGSWVSSGCKRANILNVFYEF